VPFTVYVSYNKLRAIYELSILQSILNKHQRYPFRSQDGLRSRPSEHSPVYRIPIKHSNYAKPTTVVDTDGDPRGPKDRRVFNWLVLCFHHHHPSTLSLVLAPLSSPPMYTYHNHSLTGFVALIVFLVGIILVCGISAFFLLRSPPSSLPTQYRSRNRPRTRRHHQSVPSTSSPLPLPTITTVTPTTTKPKGWRWPNLFRAKVTSPTGSTSKSKDRGWFQTGSMEWDFDNDNDHYESPGRPGNAPRVREFRQLTATTTRSPPARSANATPVGMQTYAPPTSSSPVSMEDSPFRPSAQYSLSESIISSAHFDSPSLTPHHTHSRSNHGAHNTDPRSEIGAQFYTSASSPSPPPRPILATQLSSSPPSSPLHSPKPLSPPVPIPDAGTSRGQEARQDSAQSAASVWTFQGGTKFIESL